MFSQLQNDIIKKYRDIKIDADRFISGITSSGQWDQIKKEEITQRKESFLQETYEAYELNPRVVSSYTFEDFKIDNVLLQSPLGIEVNTTVFSPIEKGQYPGVLVLTGSSRKLNRHYWTSSQQFAKNGYVAVHCDVMGFVSERQKGNDAFFDASLGYLIGYSHINSFMSDIRACLDYMDQRPDIDSSYDYLATGVSLGGTLTMYAGMLEDRVKIMAPVCCAMELNDRVADLYTISPMQYGRKAMEKGFDFAYKLALCAPKKCLLITGKDDEVFTPENQNKCFQMANQIYNLYEENLLNQYIDPNSGHSYTTDMAAKVIQMLNKHHGYENKELHISITEIEEEKMMSYPNTDVTVYDIIKSKAAAYKENRKKLSKEQLKEKAKELLNMDPIEHILIAKSNYKRRLWVHDFQKQDIIINNQYTIPSILIKRDDKKRRGLLVVDEKGMWESIYHDGIATKEVRFLNRTDDENEPCVLTIDAATCGDNQLRKSFQDAVSWSDYERNTAFLSFAINKPVMGYITRDILASIEYLRSLENVDENNISILATRRCAIAALHAALIDGNINMVNTLHAIDSYEVYFNQYPYKENVMLMIPDVLKYYDLGELT